jgi:hypothetical protein
MRNILQSNDLRILFSHRSENHSDMCDTTFGYEARGFRFYDYMLSRENSDVKTLNLDVNPEGVLAFA